MARVVREVGYGSAVRLLRLAVGRLGGDDDAGQPGRGFEAGETVGVIEQGCVDLTDPNLARVLCLCRSAGARLIGVSTTSCLNGGVSADAGFVPVAGGSRGGGEDLCLQRASAGDDGDGFVVGAQADFADAVELAQGAGGGEVLADYVGVGDCGGLEVACDEGLGDGGVDAHGDVAADALFGPVPDRPQPQARI